jgi:hypothetical protein
MKKKEMQKMQKLKAQFDKSQASLKVAEEKLTELRKEFEKSEEKLE